MRNKERPEGLLRARAHMRRFLDSSDEALDARMADTQTQPAQNEQPPVDVEYRRMLEQEIEEERQVAARMRAWNERRGSRMGRGLYCTLCVLVCAAMISLFLLLVAALPEYGSADHPVNNEVSARYIESGLQETGAVNIVTGMILDYRAFDTLGESSVLFTAAMAVLLLLRLDADSQAFSPLARAIRQRPHSDTFYEPHHDTILQYTARILVPVVLLLGVYVVLNGHLSPGGGFSGGAIMGAALMIYVTAFGFDSIRRFFTYKTYQRVVLCALLTYALSKCYSFYTGANGIHSIIPLGTPGAILSSGLILVLNICVGFIVTCTMYAFYALFRKGEL